MLQKWNDLDGTFSINLGLETEKVLASANGQFLFGRSLKPQTETYLKLNYYTGKILQGIRGYILANGLPGSNVWIPIMLKQYVDDSLKNRHLIAELCAEQMEFHRDSKQSVDDGTIMYRIMNDPLQVLSRGKRPCFSVTPEEAFRALGTMFMGVDGMISALQFALYLLAQYPSWQHKLREHIRRETHGTFPTHEKIKSIPLLRMVLYESMRIYPTAQGGFRQCTKMTQVDGYDIPAGMNVRFLYNIMNMDQDLWKHDVNEFNPLRFKDGIEGATKELMTFLPFSTGERRCLGRQLVLAQLEMIMACIVQNYHLQLDSEHPLELVYHATMKPKHGITLRLCKIQI